MRRTALLLALAAFGCGGPYRLAETGVRENFGLFSVDPQLEWNIQTGPRVQGWTIDGFWLHELLIIQGVRDGHPLLPAFERREHAPLFRSGMTPPELQEFITASLALLGSRMIKASPIQAHPFGSLTGFRIDVEYLDSTGLEVQGIFVGVVHDGRLWAIYYRGAKELIFPRDKEAVERMISSIQTTR